MVAEAAAPKTTPTVAIDRLTLQHMRTENEETYFALMLFFSASSWLWLIILFPLVLVGAFTLYCVMQLFLAQVRGNGVKVGPEQFPELHARIVQASQRLGLKTVPDAYIVQAGGTLNALATKLLGRNFIVIYSELIEACGPDDKALDFVIGHELGHIALGHLKWALWLLPAKFTPLIGQAYSRACEYSCDRCGVAVAGDLESASRGLAVLAAGGTMGRKMSLAAFSNQALEETKRFWAHIYELNSTHPFLTKRVRALRNFVHPNSEPKVRRAVLPIFLAPVLGQPVAFVVAFFYLSIIGLAVGVPSFMKYQAQAKQAEARVLVRQCGDAQRQFFAANKRYAVSFAEMGLVASPETYTLSMGAEQLLGPSKDLPESLRGYAIADEGYVCVAAANSDGDETWDVWVIDPTLQEPHHYVDDETDLVNDWGEDVAEE